MPGTSSGVRIVPALAAAGSVGGRAGVELNAELTVSLELER